jgi:hypothetical protein
MEHVYDFKTFEALIQSNSLKQLKRVMDISKDTDIDNKVRKEISEPPKTHRNPITDGIETYQDYMNEPFKVNQNIKKWK